MDIRYINYLAYCDSKLNELPKLSIKNILIYPEPYKMFLLFYYGYSSIYKKYKLGDLNRRDYCKRLNVYILMANWEKIKEIKYLVSKGVNIHYYYYEKWSAYLITVACGNIRLVKYLESIGINIHKKNCRGNNAYLIAAGNGHIKLMKHLEKKDINIYLRNIYGANFLNKYWPNYNKITPYVFKNMNYKLNRFKMCLIGASAHI
jgi:hypothetical protein